MLLPMPDCPVRLNWEVKAVLAFFSSSCSAFSIALSDVAHQPEDFSSNCMHYNTLWRIAINVKFTNEDISHRFICRDPSSFLCLLLSVPLSLSLLLRSSNGSKSRVRAHPGFSREIQLSVMFRYGMECVTSELRHPFGT